MLQNIKELYGFKLVASDGEIGHIKDFYFDDQRWALRYLVADTGAWLPGRLVLISPHAFGMLDCDKSQLHVNLTQQQIDNSPSIDTDRPISRQYEQNYHAYYGWPTYWTGNMLWGAAGFPIVNSTPSQASLQPSQDQRNDLHLRSTQAVIGYDIQATDGSLGSVASFMVDDKSWAVGQIVVEAGHWYSGKEILIPPSKIKRLSYEDSKVFIDLSKADLRRTAANEIAEEVR